MATTTTTQAGTFDSGLERTGFSWLERLALRRSHPVSIFIDVAAWTWGIYFLAARNWPAALAALVAARVFALTAVRNLSLESMAASPLGKIALLHLHPVNLIVQAVGGVALLWGVWTRATEMILAGVSVVLLGHLFGWSKVDPRYSLSAPSST